MKKFLSLVLALVMTMSLVTISAGAKDFTDDDKITYEEAVAVVSEIGVVDGYADGKFNPTNTLTRQAAAKIICNLILGPTTAAELHADTAPYKDVPATSEFAGYIAYCAKEGIISGYADGSFKPGNTLTGYAFMKMLLGALGYEQETEGYTGANWSINVAKQAIGIGLNKSLKTEFNGVKAVTREEACLYAFNTLKATMVEYDEKTTINVGGAEVVLSGKAQDVAWGTAKLNDGNIKKDGFVQFAEKHFPKLVRKDDTDAFGRPTNAWSNNKKDIGAYMNYDLLVSEYTTKVKGGDVYSDVGSVAADFDLTYYQDGEAMTKTAAKEQAAQIAKKNDEDMGDTGNGVLTQIFVDTDAEELTITEINTYLAETDDYNEKKETLKLEPFGYNDDVAALKLEDFPTIEGYEDGDLVLVTIAKGEVQSIADPETVDGVEIDEFSKHDYVKADGEKYSYAKTGALENESYHYDILNDYDNNNLDDKTFNLFLDPYGYVIGIEQVEDDVEYVFITAYENYTEFLSKKSVDANAIFSDGTMKVIKVDLRKSFQDENSDYDWNAAGNRTVNKWFTYTVKNDVYSLEYAPDQFQDTENASATGSVAKTIDSKHVYQTKTVDKKNTYYYGNADTVYITVSVDNLKGSINGNGDTVAVIDDVVSVATGVKNVSIDVWTNSKVLAESKATQSAPSSQGIYSVYEGGYIVASVVIGDDGETSSKFAYLFGGTKNEKYNKSEDMYYWDMKAIVDGAETVITFKSELEPSDDYTEGLYKVSFDGEYAIKAASRFTVDGDDVKWLTGYAAAPDDAKVLTKSNQTVNMKADGLTLYVTDQDQIRGYAMAEDCPAVILTLKAGDTTVDEVAEYTTVAKAIKALNTYDKGSANFSGKLYLFFEDGILTSVIMIENGIAEPDGDSYKLDNATIEKSGNNLVAKWEDDGTYDGKDVVVKFYLKEDGKSYLKDTATGTCSNLKEHTQTSSTAIAQNGDYYAVISVLDTEGKVIDTITTDVVSFAF